MENASKALIIAGAILLSILIIGLGMFIYNQAAGVMGDTGLDQTEIQSYNEQFERYEGPTVKGATVKAMIDTVRNHNNATLQDPSKFVVLEASSEKATDADASSYDENTLDDIDYADLKGAIRSGAQYTVSCGHDKKTGLVTTIAYNLVSD